MHSVARENLHSTSLDDDLDGAWQGVSFIFS